MSATVRFGLSVVASMKMACRRARTLVGELLIVRTLELTGALLDRALDVHVRHVGGLGLVDREAEARVASRIAAPAFAATVISGSAWSTPTRAVNRSRPSCA
jgi:hypothetical protein